MNLARIKLWVGIIIIGSHLVAMAIVVLIDSRVLFGVSDVIDVLLVLSPIFSAYSSVIVSDFLKQGTTRAKGARVNAGFLFTVTAIPGVFCAAIIGLVVSIATGSLPKDDAIRCLGVVESLLGAFLAAIVGNLFGVAPKKMIRDRVNVKT